jgi:hypothetical protein
MKKYIFYFSMVLIVLSSACKKYDIITSKPGEQISPVTNLSSSVSGNNIILNWKLPATLPGDIIKPVSVSVQISVDGQSKGSVILENAPESYTYSPYDGSKSYKFTVKVVGKVDTDDKNFSNLRYSLGETTVL